MGPADPRAGLGGRGWRCGAGGGALWAGPGAGLGGRGCCCGGGARGSQCAGSVPPPPPPPPALAREARGLRRSLHRDGDAAVSACLGRRGSERRAAGCASRRRRGRDGGDSGPASATPPALRPVTASRGPRARPGALAGTRLGARSASSRRRLGRGAPARLTFVPVGWLDAQPLVRGPGWEPRAGSWPERAVRPASLLT